VGRQSADWEAQLLQSKDFRTMPKIARAKLYRDQIKPTLWYTAELAEKVGLPKDFVVWHYHPVRFVAWMNSQLRKQATTMVGADSGRARTGGGQSARRSRVARRLHR
jgi:Tfp pilus assembly protein PilX